MANYRINIRDKYSWQPPVADKDLTTHPSTLVLDQSQSVHNASGGGLNTQSAKSVGQSFTAGKSGSLDNIRVWFGKSGDTSGHTLTMNLYLADGSDKPTGGVLATEDIADAIVRANKLQREKPMIAVLMGREGLPAGMDRLHEAKIPGYIFPESAARALGEMWRYAARKLRPAGSPVSYDTDDDAVSAIISAALKTAQNKLSEPDALRILEAYGIPVCPWQFVDFQGGHDFGNRVSTAAAELGFPVALKIVSPQIVHKTDVGGVVLGLDSTEEVRSAADEIVQRVAVHSESVDGLVVQKMAESGMETIVGITRVPDVGLMVMFGLGGVYVEVMKDVVLRLCPILDTDATEMISEVKMHKLLEGVRGEAPRDLDALAETILKLAQLAERHEEIVEMDINPLVSFEKGAMAIDARIQVESG